MAGVSPLPLSCLLGKERTKDIEQARQDLVSRGWTFLYKDDETKLEQLPTTEIVQRYLNDINEDFFEVSQNDKDGFKQKDYPANRFGYFSTGRKEGYRFATGSKLNEFVIPGTKKNGGTHAPFHEVAAACDEICHQIYENQGQYLFGANSEGSESMNSYVKQNIPLLNGSYEHHDFSQMNSSPKTESQQSFGLFDIVKYRPKSQFPEEFSATDSQVNEHADPGLFSLSLGSTAEGLEMFDPSTNEWIKVPLNVMVLWCGHAVTDVSSGQVKTGIHRVVANEGERLTCWYEVCVNSQVPQKRTDMNHSTANRERILWDKELELGISMSKSMDLADLDTYKPEKKAAKGTWYNPLSWFSK